MAENDDDITLEDLDKIIPLFRWVFIISGFVIIGGIIFAGVKSWPWYLVLPIGGILHFGNRTLKTMIIGGAEKTRKELHVDYVKEEGLSIDEMKFEDFSELDEGQQRASLAAKAYEQAEAPRRSLPVNGIVLIGGLMLLVSGFWYGLGKILALIFG